MFPQRAICAMSGRIDTDVYELTAGRRRYKLGTWDQKQGRLDSDMRINVQSSHQTIDAMR